MKLEGVLFANYFDKGLSLLTRVGNALSISWESLAISATYVAANTFSEGIGHGLLDWYCKKEAKKNLSYSTAF